MSEVIITTPADPDKVAAYRASNKGRKPRQKLDKMGRKKAEKTGMTKETANYILDQREAKRLYTIFKED